MDNKEQLALLKELEAKSRFVPDTYGTGVTLDSKARRVMLAGLVELIGVVATSRPPAEEERVEVKDPPADLFESLWDRLDKLTAEVANLAAIIKAMPKPAPRKTAKGGKK